MRPTLAMSLLWLLATSCSRSEPGKPSGLDTSTPASPTSSAAPAKRAKDPEAARRLIAAGAAVIDVRTAEEYGEGHLANAYNIPVDTVADRLPELAQLVGGDKTKPIVVYCASGHRARSAQQTLEAGGFTNVVNGGGLDDLQ